MRFNAVVETNTASVRLWKSLGFEILGHCPRDFGTRPTASSGCNHAPRALTADLQYATGRRRPTIAVAQLRLRNAIRQPVGERL